MILVVWVWGVTHCVGATKLVFVQQPITTAAGVVFSPPVTLQVQDGLGGKIATAGVHVVMGLISGTGTLSGTLTNATDEGGLATFDDLSIGLVGTNKQLSATAVGFAPATSSVFVVESLIQTQAFTLTYEGLGLTNGAVLSGAYPGLTAATVTHYGTDGGAVSSFESVAFWSDVSPANGYGNLTNVVLGPTGVPAAAPAYGVIRIQPEYPGSFVRVRSLDLASLDDDLNGDEFIEGVYVVDPGDPFVYFGGQAPIQVAGDANNTAHTLVNFSGVPINGLENTSVAILWDAQEGRVAADNVQFEIVGPAPRLLARDDFYIVPQGGTLVDTNLGVLGNDLLREPSGPLSASVLAWPQGASLSLSTNGGFTFASTNGYGMDGFIYRATDADLRVSDAAAIVSVVPPGVILYDDFVRPPGLSSLMPWESASGSWTITNGYLQGSSSLQSYGYCYWAADLTDYSVEMILRLPVGGFSAILGGRLNPATGGHYGVALFPVQATNWVLRLIKFSAWDTWSGYALNFQSDIPVPDPGPDSHVLGMTFVGNVVRVDYDGQTVAQQVDEGFEGAPYAGGGVVMGLYTDADPYRLNIERLRVLRLPEPNESFEIQSIALTNGLVVLTWDSVAGGTYRVEYQEDVRQTNWTADPPDILANGTSASATVISGNAAQRYYRVRRLP